MTSMVRGAEFLRAAVGDAGFAALKKAADRYPAIAEAILPRVCIAWLDVARRCCYEGEVPGTDALLKGGELHAQGVSEPLEHLHPAVSLLLVEVAGDQLELPEEFDPKLVSRLAKSIDLLTKRTFLMVLRDLEEAHPQKTDEESSTETSPNEGTSTDGEVSGSSEDPELEKGVALPGKASGPIPPEAPAAPTPQSKQKGQPSKQALKSESGVVGKGMQYAYHVTHNAALPSISEKGLLPQPHPHSDEPVIFVERDEDGAAVYHEPGKTVMLRMPVSGYGCTEDGEDVLHDPVAPERIEVRNEQGWVPLKKPQ